MEKELRVYDNEVEVRQLDDGTEVISGYAVVFNSESRDLGGFIETIAPTAFNEADMTDVLALFNHDNNLVLGRTPSTLTLSIDQKGVRYEIKPPDTTTANDLKKSIARGDVRGSSFGFTIHKDGDTWEKPKERGGLYRRMVTRVRKLWDVSPVVTPAYVATDTTIARRSLGVLKDKEEVEVTQKIQRLNEVEALKLKNQLDKIDGDLTYHDNGEEYEKIERQENAVKKEARKKQTEAEITREKKEQELRKLKVELGEEVPGIDMDEEKLKLRRQLQQMAVDLAYHETFEKTLKAKEIEFEKKRKGQLRKFDADFKLTNKETFNNLDDIKMEE